MSVHHDCFNFVTKSHSQAGLTADTNGTIYHGWYVALKIMTVSVDACFMQYGDASNHTSDHHCNIMGEKCSLWIF